MNTTMAIATVRDCLKAVKPDLDLESLTDHDPLLESRVITSLDVLDLIIHLEQASGRSIISAQLVAGSFRDVNTIARIFLSGDDRL